MTGVALHLKLVIHFWKLVHLSLAQARRLFIIHWSPTLVLTAGPEKGILTVEMESGDEEPEDLRPQCVEWLADKVRASLGCDAPSVRALFDENPQAIDDFLQGAPTGNFLTQRFYRSARRNGPVARPFDPTGTRETHPTTVH